VEKRTLICAVAALNLAIGVACSNVRGEDNVTVAGCLSASEDGRYALTAAPDAALATAARAMDNEHDTHTYMLVGGENLQVHLGKRVEVTGTLSGRQDYERESKTKTEAPPATSGGDTPTVKTKEDIDLEARQLKVREVREVAPTCTVNP
jgi:hypothetical protein